MQSNMNKASRPESEPVRRRRRLGRRPAVNVLNGGAIQELRIGMDISQEELGERVGISKGFTSQIEAGKVRVSDSIMETLSQVLGVEKSELLKKPLTDSAKSSALSTQDTLLRILEGMEAINMRLENIERRLP